MDTLFKYYSGSLEEFILEARNINDNRLMKIQLAPSKLEDYPSFTHVLDNFAVRHIFMKHANDKEELRGQIKINNEDFLYLNDIISYFDTRQTEILPGGRTLTTYSKEYSDCTRFYVEEIRRGRLELAGVTYYKRKRKLTGAKS